MEKKINNLNWKQNKKLKNIDLREPADCCAYGSQENINRIIEKKNMHAAKWFSQNAPIGMKN